ncbi:hypothetical protein OG379_34140 [Streptomyces sp. NBC_01166]|uniref:acyl-CoA-like ligand-binding transcription factor n=1 Tax=Streptomyces sp. NBC_01166 TaxID=2903755 RepID=UPI00386F7C66|nr:hypothetical protein OG379_34140 [Streptomyces sp. NBC_01166]
MERVTPRHGRRRSAAQGGWASSDFRSKESCAEPIVTQGVVTLMTVLRSWPRQSSIEDHLAAELVGLRHGAPPVDLADEMLAMKMIRLADTEPALRTAWLMACDQVERQMCGTIGDRLGRPADDLEVRLHAAATASGVRVLDKHIGAALLAGADLTEFTDVAAVARRYAHAIRTATSEVVGDPSSEDIRAGEAGEARRAERGKVAQDGARPQSDPFLAEVWSDLPEKRKGWLSFVRNKAHREQAFEALAARYDGVVPGLRKALRDSYPSSRRSEAAGERELGPALPSACAWQAPIMAGSW